MARFFGSRSYEFAQTWPFGDTAEVAGIIATLRPEPNPAAGQFVAASKASAVFSNRDINGI